MKKIEKYYVIIIMFNDNIKMNGIEIVLFILFIFKLLILPCFAIIALVLSSIIISEKISFATYTVANCSGLIKSYIGTSPIGYYCYGYANINNENGTHIGMVKLNNPIYNKYLVKVSLSDCAAWITSLTNNNEYTCFVESKSKGKGYTILQNITEYYILLSLAIIIFMIIICLFAAGYIDNKDNTDNYKKNNTPAETRV